jgi:hypothetical protein
MAKAVYLLFGALCFGGTASVRIGIRTRTRRDGDWVVASGEGLSQINGPSSATDKQKAESITIHDCIDQVQDAYQNLALASHQALTNKNKDKVGAREEPVSSALEVWCNKKFFSKQPELPQDMTVQLCHDLKDAVDMDVENGKQEDFDDISTTFCVSAQRATSQAFSREVDGHQLMGSDLIGRLQFASKLPPVATFYGTRAHNSLDETDWDPHALCCKPHDRTGCKNATISQCVCELDSFCCQSNWDIRCAQSVEELKCGKCSAPSSVITGNATSPMSSVPASPEPVAKAVSVDPPVKTANNELTNKTVASNKPIKRSG